MSGKVYIQIDGDRAEGAYEENGELILYRRFDGEIEGGVYRGKVTRINSAGVFVDIGRERQGILQRRDGINVGDFLTVQVKRKEKESKGCILSEKITIAGKFVVKLAENGNRFSRKISESRKKELDKLSSGFLFRTRSENADDSVILNEIAEINAKYEKILKEGQHLYKVKELYKEDLTELVVNSLPQGEIVYSMDGIREKINVLNNNRVEKKGVEIVIEKTEAMTVIDVNSHNFVSTYKNSEAASLAVNLIAAEIVAKQLRLRNIGGIIAVDFVTMKEPENVEKLKKELTRFLEADEALCKFDFSDKLCIALIVRPQRYSSI